MNKQLTAKSIEQGSGDRKCNRVLKLGLDVHYRQVTADRTRYEARGKGLLCAQGIEVQGQWWQPQPWKELKTHGRFQAWMETQLKGWRRKLLSAGAEKNAPDKSDAPEASKERNAGIRRSIFTNPFVNWRED
jgi:hypothetical protein